MSIAQQTPVATAGSEPEVEAKPSLVLPLLQLPSVVVLFLWMIVPLGMTIYFSFIRKNLLNPELTGFAGLENYKFLWEDPAFVPAIINSIILIGAVLVITVALGTLFAVLFDREFFGKNVATLLVIAPFFVMPTVSALIWKNMMMHPVYGVLAVFMNKLGLPAIDWFSTHPLLSIIIIVSWEWLPFAFLILFTSIKSLDQEQKEAAAVDGANPVQFFFYVTLAHLSRAIGVVVMIETIFLLSIFAEIYTTTSGGPGTATTNLAFLVYALGLQQFDAGIASAGGILAVVLANIVAFFMVKLVAKTSRLAKETMTESKLSKWAWGILAWLVALTIFFPIFVMIITAFKNEREAQSLSLIFLPTLESFYEVFARSNYAVYVWNSILASVGSTLLCFALAIPAAYRMAFYPTPKTQSTLVWMLSTKMMPAVGVLIPLYILCQFFGVLDSIVALIIIYALINLPIAVWMAYTYFCEIPGAILEAARIDGATIWGELWHVLRPMTLPGLSSTGLLLIILSWNEAFWSLNLTSVNAAPLPVFIASYSSPEGLFWAKLSAASFLAVAPIMVLGWMTQKQLVRGLTFGAVK